MTFQQKIHSIYSKNLLQFTKDFKVQDIDFYVNFNKNSLKHNCTFFLCNFR